MKTKDVLVIGCTALVTAALALGTMQPLSRANATQAQKATLTVAPATLDTEGVQLSVTKEKDKFEAGEKPTMSLRAINTGGKEKTVTVKVRMMATRPASPMARMVSLPSETWSDSVLVALKPRETKTFELQPGVPLPAGQEVFVTLQVGNKIVRAAGLSAPVRDPRMAILTLQGS